MKNNRILPVLLFPLVISLSGCNGQAKTEATFDPNEVKEVPFVINSSRLYGVTDLSYQEYYWPKEGKKISYEQSHNLFKILGAKSARFWAHFNYCMSDPTTFIPHQFRVLRACYDDLVTRNPGIQVIGMNHTNFHAEYAGETNANTASSKPPRDLTPGSRYMRWLADYEQSWFTLVKAFP